MPLQNSLWPGYQFTTFYDILRWYKCVETKHGWEVYFLGSIFVSLHFAPLTPWLLAVQVTTFWVWKLTTQMSACDRGAKDLCWWKKRLGIWEFGMPSWNWESHKTSEHPIKILCWYYHVRIATSFNIGCILLCLHCVHVPPTTITISYPITSYHNLNI